MRRCTYIPFSPNSNAIYTSHFATHKHCGLTLMHVVIPALGPGPHCIETVQCELTLTIRHGTLQLWIAARAILRTVDCHTHPTTDRTACTGGEGERENGPSVPQKGQNRRKSGAKCGESATQPSGLPRAQTLRECLLRSACSGIQCIRAATQEGTEPGTEEGAKLTQLVEARVHRRNSTREQKRMILLTV